MNTAIIDDPIFQQHETGFGHPECPSRVGLTHDFIRQQYWYPYLNRIAPKEVSLDQIEVVHDMNYISRLEKHCAAGKEYLDSPDVAICNNSWQVAKLAAGSLLQMADDVMVGKATNGFALTRPPGHHAEMAEALGFCLLNNVAILARYLQQHHQLEKILIFDWDVHHGNGTQHLFESDPSVLYISTHQYPYYPGTGSYAETGEGKGKGATLNCPMSAGAGVAEYEQVLMQKVLPKIDQFKPDFILISAGFDAHHSDPLGDINLSTEFYGWMTHVIMEAASKHCHDRIISVLEGGYNLQYLPLCVAEHLSHLSRNQCMQTMP